MVLQTGQKPPEVGGSVGGGLVDAFQVQRLAGAGHEVAKSRRTHQTRRRRRAAGYVERPRAATAQTASTIPLRAAYIWSYRFTTGSQCETISSSLSPTA